jgi:ubiquinone/menaquinone biosynthesis C-methylase UbiE
MDRKQHWENVYQTKGPNEVSWFREHLDTSLRMITNTGIGKDVAVIDIGGGASTLVDDLLEKGFKDLTVLDISASALDMTKERLGNRADLVN